MIYECEPGCVYCKNYLDEVEKRFLKYVNKTQTCWLWTGGIDKAGYGRFSYSSEGQYAHRFSKALMEKLKPGLEIDHLCRVRHCVNPDHLEQVDHRTNIFRSPIAPATINKNKTTCPKGHSDYRQTKHGRVCRQCAKEYYPAFEKSPARKAYRKQYKEENKERIAAYQKKYMKEYMREYNRRKKQR